MALYEVPAKVLPDTVDPLALQKYLVKVIDRRKKKKRASFTDKRAQSKATSFIELISGKIEASETKIICEDSLAQLEDYSPVLEDSKFDIAFKYSKTDQSVIDIWSPTIPGCKKALLFSFSVDLACLPFLWVQDKFFKPKFQHKPSVNLEKPYLTGVRLKSAPDGTAVFAFTIRYRIAVGESINEYYSLDFIRTMRELMEFIATPNLTLYEKGGAKTKEEEKSMMVKPSEASFYALITTNTERHTYDANRANMQLPGIHKQLLGFQSQTLEWMLVHEGRMLGLETPPGSKPVFVSTAKPRTPTDDDESLSKALDEACFGWSRLVLDADTYWYNSYTGNLCTSDFARAQLSKPVPITAQAMLSEEMGLGKTLEVISLVQIHPRQSVTQFDEKKLDLYSGERFLSECKTTLIICPQTIIGQWYSEVKQSSDLSVMIYEGITSYERDAEDSHTDLQPEDVARRLAAYDIVLVSYHTVARELHRAVFRPTTRPARHCAKRLRIASPGVAFDYSGKMINSDGSSDVEDDGQEYHRIDYSSPLMLLEFWRVVLDEVQMTASINTNAAKFARIIPRIHAWGVSGTLIKNGLDDLQSLLSFLRFNPVSRFSTKAADSPWKLMTEQAPFYQFSRLFMGMTLRHTKKMVASQIQLPAQNRIMLKAPFSSIERDNYDFLFNQFLTQVGLDENGDPTIEEYDPSRSYTYMRQWLIKLRQMCSHAQLGRPVYIKKHNDSDDSESLVVGTLGEVLEDLIKTTFDEFATSDRAYYALQLKKGRIFEFLRCPEDSMKLFEEVIPQLESKIQELVDDNDAENVNGPKIRSWMELLHQTYFLLASAHYQHYKPMRPVPDRFEDLPALEVRDDTEKLQIDRELLADDQKVHYDLENVYYNKADALLMKILDEPLAKVDEAIASMLDRFNKQRDYKVTDVKLSAEEVKKLENAVAADDTLKDVCKSLNVSEDLLDSNLGFDAMSSLFFERLQKTLTQLNLQAHIINAWVGMLVKLLQEPVTRDQEKEQLTGEEYGDTLVNQELANTYIEELETILEDREHTIVSAEQMPSFRRKNQATRTRHKEAFTLDENHPTNKELHKKLDQVRRDFLPSGCFNSKYSLNLLWAEANSISEDIGVTGGAAGKELGDLLHEISSELKKLLSSQKKNITELRTKVFDSLNDTFNAKVNYFRVLQVKSDALTNYTPIKPHKTVAGDHTPIEAAQVELRNTEKELEQMKSTMRLHRVRLKYLKSIPKEEDEDEGEEEQDAERICVICRSKILVGTLTACGHQYCKECLEEWRKIHSTCPVCNRKLHKSDLYTFTRTKKQLTGGVVNDGEVKEEEEENDVDVLDEQGQLNNKHQVDKDLFKIYKSLDDDLLREIMNIPLKQSYGSKVDMIVRQVLFLREHENHPQILVFSQWPQFLKILGHSMRQNDIEYLSSVEPTRKYHRRDMHSKSLQGSEDIETFKRNRDITCFFLNAKADAAGLTLTNASHVFLCEPLVNLPLELQAISRVHRIGQLRQTTVWNFVIENSVEESIAYMSTKKRLELAREEENGEEYVDEDAIGVTELSKNLDKFVDKNDGEVIANDDLWASFFAAKSTSVTESLVGMHAATTEGSAGQ